MTIEEQTAVAAYNHAADKGSRAKGNAIIDFISGAQWERQRDKWISVKDELPAPNPNEHSDQVLVWDFKYGLGAAFYLHDRGHWSTHAQCITHWMPIPELPKPYQS